MSASTEAVQQGDAARQEVVALIDSLYGAYGDRASFDSHLDSDVSVWESDAPALLLGLGDLDKLRDRRSLDHPPAAIDSLVAELQHLQVWGDTALVCYLLRGEFVDRYRPAKTFRVTDVLRRRDGGWRIVHHHSEELTG